ncbi:MAG: chorismate synthase [Planctomycetia bacterium]|nr:chorismate synthase [Planctomycetia bacterium]
MLRYLTGGESHGRTLMAILDGFPAGLTVSTDFINADLVLRQGGYGRGGRQNLETDHVEFLSGVLHGTTTGAPITLQVPNRDFRIEDLEELKSPRPGHGDLAGSIKYESSIRSVLERASARETAVKVATGSLARLLLAEFGIDVLGYVVAIGSVDLTRDTGPMDLKPARERRAQSCAYTLVPERDTEIRNVIDQARDSGDTLGGIVEIRATGLPFGLGSHVQWDRRLDGRLAQAVMAVQAIKGVEIGAGFDAARLPGSQVHDAIEFDETLVETEHRGWRRSTNRAGGLEGGMTNSEPLVIRAAMKPIPTMRRGLPSVTMTDHQPVTAAYERSDVCAVPAAAIVLEAVVAITLAGALCEKYGEDSVAEMKRRFRR